MSNKKVLIGILATTLIVAVGSVSYLKYKSYTTILKHENIKTEETVIKPTVKPNMVSPTESLPVEATENKFNVLEIIDLTKEEIIKKLGDYKVVPTGAEGAFKGFKFEKYGIVILFRDEDVFDSKDAPKSPVYYIYCDSSVEVKGVRKGMNFEQIQKILGKEQVYDGFIETPDNKTYNIAYDFEDCRLTFTAYQKDGKDSGLAIHPRSILYKNSTFNFKLSIPKKWFNMYNITENPKGITIFYNKSNVQYEFNIEKWGDKRAWDKWYKEVGKDKALPFEKVGESQGLVFISKVSPEYYVDSNREMLIDYKEIINSFRPIDISGGS